MDEFLTAQRATVQTRLGRVGSRQAAVMASAYSNGPCTAQASIDSFSTLTEASVFGSGRSQNFWFDNLTPDTAYQYRLRCPDGVFVNGFRTHPVGPTRRFQLNLTPPPAWAVTNAVIYTGSSPGALSASATLACATGCTLNQAAVDGTILYYRVEYRRSNNAVISAGPVRAWTP